MTDHETPNGLLTPDERELLADHDADPGDRDDLRETIRERLRPALVDLQVLYLTLRDEDLDTVFCPESEHEQSTVRSATQYAIGLLALGAFRNDDLIETRVEDALQYAGFAHGEAVTADVELRRGPIPSFERCLARFEADGLTDETMALWEHLLWNAEIDPDRVVAASERFGEPASVEEVHEAREGTAAFERPPQSAITNVSVERVDDGHRP